MLSREQIDERLATWALDNSQREALETAQKLGEWVANADHGQDVVELLKARAWLREEEGVMGHSERKTRVKHTPTYVELEAERDKAQAAIQAKCLSCDDYWLCRTVDTPPDCPLYPYRGGEF